MVPRLVSAVSNRRELLLCVMKHSVLALCGPVVVLSVVMFGTVTGAGGNLLCAHAPYGALALRRCWARPLLKVVLILQTMAGLARSCTLTWSCWAKILVILWCLLM